MKLSELSYREYLAIEFLPAFMRHYSALGGSEEQVAENAAKYSFVYADAFMRVAGREAEMIDHKLKEADCRVARAEASVILLRSMNEDGNYFICGELEDIWEFLGVTDQTTCMQALRDRNEALKTLAEWPSDIPNSLREIAVEALK